MKKLITILFLMLSVACNAQSLKYNIFTTNQGASIIAGTNVTVSSNAATGVWTISATSSATGSVTSVGVTSATPFIVISGSPITSSGNIGVSNAYSPQPASANLTNWSLISTSSVIYGVAAGTGVTTSTNSGVVTVNASAGSFIITNILVSNITSAVSGSTVLSSGTNASTNGVLFWTNSIVPTTSNSTIIVEFDTTLSANAVKGMTAALVKGSDTNAFAFRYIQSAGNGYDSTAVLRGSFSNSTGTASIPLQIRFGQVSSGATITMGKNDSAYGTSFLRIMEVR